jgi:calcium-dependent protein kinase
MKLDHPVASRLLDTAEDSGYYYMITELYEGGELFDRLIERGRQSEADVANILRQVLELLSHCHTMGIVHRDLKPENIIFRNPPDAVGTHATELEVAVVDFGLAEKLAPGQVLSERVGSPHYMAPEVITSSYTQSAELWTVGVILYVMLSADMPFNGSNSSAIFGRIRNGSYDMTSVVWEQVSEDAKDLLASLLQKNPNSRPSAAAALQHRWLNGSASADAHPLAPSIVQVLVWRQYARGLQREALKAVVPLLEADTAGRVAETRRCFQDMDIDSDGFLSLDEFVIGLRKLAPAEFAASRRSGAGSSGSDGDGDVPAIFKALFSQIDRDGAGEHGNDADGYIDLEEWLVSAVVLEEFSRHHDCAQIFAQIDTDSNGRIDAAELAEFLESTSGVESEVKSQRRQLRQSETQRRNEHLHALRDWPEEGITLEEFTNLLCGSPN